jgi:hypothetical protein
VSAPVTNDHDLDAEIGAAMRESVEAHRERQRSTWANFVAAWERLFKRPYPGNEEAA